MARKKGGLGSVAASTDPIKEDLLSSVFGESPAGQTNREKPKANPPAGEDPDGKVAKYFRIDRTLAKRIKIYAAEHELREIQVIEKALRLLFEEGE